MPRARAEEPRTEYRNALIGVAQNRGAAFVDPIELIRTRELCSRERGHEVIYRDRDHLNTVGTRAVVADLVQKARVT